MDPSSFRALTTWSLVGLAGGLALGLAGHAFELTWVGFVASAVEPLGTLWINALQMTVIPLVIAQLLAALTTQRDGDSIGVLGGRTLGLMLVILVVGGVYTLTVAPPILDRWQVNPETIQAIRADTPVPEAARVAAGEAVTPSVGSWLSTLVPRNPFEAAVRGDLLPLLVFTVLFGLAVSRLPAEKRAPLAAVFRSAAEAFLVLVGWILWGTPVAVFAILLSVALSAGSAAAGILVFYVVVLCLLLIVFTLLFYPVTAVVGRTSLGTFARAALPAQLVAVSTRSSIASLPAMIEGGRRHLRLPEAATAFVLPLTVSSFKPNQPVFAVFNYLLLAHLFGVPVTVASSANFLFIVILLSFTVVGVPLGGGAFRTLPAYLAVGLPIEGVVMLEAVKTIPDIFMTSLNVTGDLSVATMVTRGSREGATGGLLRRLTRPPRAARPTRG